MFRSEGTQEDGTTGTQGSQRVICGEDNLSADTVNEHAQPVNGIDDDRSIDIFVMYHCALRAMSEAHPGSIHRPCMQKPKIAWEPEPYPYGILPGIPFPLCTP